MRKGFQLLLAGMLLLVAVGAWAAQGLQWVNDGRGYPWPNAAQTINSNFWYLTNQLAISESNINYILLNCCGGTPATYYLLDDAGNFLTDEGGNRMTTQ